MSLEIKHYDSFHLVRSHFSCTLLSGRRNKFSSFEIKIVKVNKVTFRKELYHFLNYHLLFLFSTYPINVNKMVKPRRPQVGIKMHSINAISQFALLPSTVQHPPNMTSNELQPWWQRVYNTHGFRCRCTYNNLITNMDAIICLRNTNYVYQIVDLMMDRMVYCQK